MRDEFKNSENWSKRFLPHYNAGHKYQMITYRLADSLPQAILHSLASNNLGAPQATAGKNNKDQETQKRKLIEDTLDKSLGSCILKYGDAAELVLENWQHFHKQRYDLIAYVIMPNHVHILIKTYEDIPLSKIVWSWKSYTARRILNIPELKQKYLDSFLKVNTLQIPSRAPEVRQQYLKPAVACGAPRNITLWQREYWDRFIRDENHFQKAIEYIHMNPVKAGLVDNADDWAWSSING